MAVPLTRIALIGAIGLTALCARADEIRLKDGKKLFGVIVAYEGNMFKVKTDFGYVLVEKDKIASIIPTTPAPSTDPQPPKATDSKGIPNAQPKTEVAVAPGSDAAPALTAASAKSVPPIPLTKSDKTGRLTGAPVKPQVPTGTVTAQAVPPVMKGNPPGTAATLVTASAPLPAPPKEPEVPAIREEVQGNIYTNHTHGFRMFKAPSWQLIDDARNALPNAIVAMGTADESSLLVVGKEKAKDPLDAAAVAVEKRLHEVYESYRLAEQKKTTVGGSPAIEFRYRGKADEHDWSGILVVIGRGNNEIFTVLGMTYADSDLIQIQENVLAKAIASLSFDVH